jgi:hypothetical protein
VPRGVDLARRTADLRTGGSRYPLGSGSPKRFGRAEPSPTNYESGGDGEFNSPRPDFDGGVKPPLQETPLAGQRLKPRAIETVCGTDESVPFRARTGRATLRGT